MIGQLAKKSKVKVETVRYCKRKGLIPDLLRRESGYRMYSESDVARIRFIKRAQMLGFTLNEIMEILSLKVDPDTTCADVKKRAEIKINDIEEKMRALKQMKMTLTKWVAICKDDPYGGCSIIKAPDSENFDRKVVK